MYSLAYFAALNIDSLGSKVTLQHNLAGIGMIPLDRRDSMLNICL